VRYFGFLILFGSLIVFYFVFLSFQAETYGKILSPVPNTGASFWFPKVENLIKESALIPKISAKSAIIYELNSNKVLFDKNSSDKLPMASLTKIMTAIVALENPKKDNKYTVRQEYLVGENSMGLEEGEILSLEELLYGLILKSGNDASETIAASFPGGRENFIREMNRKAKELGAGNTNFTNPSGLEGNGNQYTTAKDLVIITKYALDNFELFKKVSSTFTFTIPATSTHKSYALENETNLISSYPGVKGVKIGFTNEAGYCLVTFLDYKGQQIIGVLLNSENRRQEMKDLLDFSLKSLGIFPPAHS
jgi:serine-type D-Ala-D-Ala carboxypeptidase (penicillin-binding protein 5/6)